MTFLFDPKERNQGLFSEVNENTFSEDEVKLLLAVIESRTAAPLPLRYYLHGNLDKSQRFPVAIEQIEALARKALGPYLWGYIGAEAVAGNGETYRSNLSAFQKWKLLPKMATGAASKPFALDHEVAFGSFQLKAPSPIFVAPMGVQTLATKEGEIVAAQAAGDAKVSYMYSSASTTSLEDLSTRAKDTDLFFQLYTTSVPELNLSLIDRAVKAGCRGIVLTLDTTRYALRERELELGYLPFLWKAKRETHGRNHGVGLYLCDPVFNQIQSHQFGSVADPAFTALEGGPYPVNTNHASMQFMSVVNSGASVTWDEQSKDDPFAIDWFVNEITTKRKLPFIIKGILREDDAIRAVRKGVSGVYVTNHGGRQVNGSISAIDALKPIADAVREESARLKVPKPAILFDSGIRRGCEIVKAYALGADWVGIGRPVLYGMAMGSQEGVKHVLDVLLADMIITTQNMGYTSVSQIEAGDIKACLT